LPDPTRGTLPPALAISFSLPWQIYLQIALPFKHFGVIHVMTAKSAEQGDSK
jgi:hypothetical protein